MDTLSALLALAGKPGYRTTEFWRGVILKVLAVLAIIFHKDLTGTATWVPLAASVLAGLDTMVYSASRASTKKALLTGTTLSAHEYGTIDRQMAKNVGVDAAIETTEPSVEGGSTEGLAAELP